MRSPLQKTHRRGAENAEDTHRSFANCPSGGLMPTVHVNPLDETPRTRSEGANRLESLSGKTIGLLDISKPGGSIFLDRIEQLLKERYGVAGVIRATKPT